MSAISLKLVNPESQITAEAFLFDRRRTTRHTVSGRATAVSRNRSPQSEGNRIRSLELLNVSATGLAALSQDAIEVGSLITVFMPPHGPERGFDAYGHVVRCQRHGSGHMVGIDYSTRPAA